MKTVNRLFVITLLSVFLPIAAFCTENKIELRFWNFWNPELILPTIEKFEKENPDIKIHNEQLTWANGLDKIVVSIANGKQPDICEMGSTWMGRFMSEGVLVDLTKELSSLKPEYLMWAAAEMNGKIYGMPWMAGTRVMFYNRDLLTQNGLDPDNPPKTWEELLFAVKKIHDPTKGFYGFGMNAGEGHILYKKFLPFVWGNNGKILDDNNNFVFTSDKTKEALEFYLKLKEYSYCEKQDLLDEAFKHGKLGFTVSGSWNFSRFPIDAPNLNFGTCLIPKPAENRGFSTSFLGGEILVIFKGCKHTEAATKFVKFLAKTENTMPITKTAWTAFPAEISAYNDPVFTKDKRLYVFCEQMKTAIHPPVNRLWIELENIINKMVENVMYGEGIKLAFIKAEKEFSEISSTTQTTTAKSSLSSKYASMLSWLCVGLLVNALLFIFVLDEYKKRKIISVTLRNQRYFVFLLPWIILFSLFWLYPLIFSFILSLCDYDVFHPEMFAFIGVKNYLQLFKDESFKQAFTNTLIFVLGTTPVTVVFALILALMVNSMRRGSAIFRSVFFLPSIISIVVTATIFKSFYAPTGIFNRILEFIGVQGHAWLVEKQFALPAIMAMNIWAYTGYYMVLFLAALTAIPKSLYEAAKVDGADEWGLFKYITLPQIRYMIVFVIAINTIRTWQAFPEIYSLTRGGPVGTTNTLVHFLYDTAFKFHEMGYASAIAYVLLAVILFFALVQIYILNGKNK